MNKRVLQLYIWPEEYIENQEALIVRFSPVVVKFDKKGAIGAGASGLLPELNLLLVVGASLLASGFLNAVGADVWKVLKKGISKLAYKKPNKKDCFLPPNFTGELCYQLLWWTYFDDERVLVIINLISVEDVSKALDSLPEKIDALYKDKIKFSKLFWNGNNWESY